jgi:hypothetical protein
MRCIHLVPCRFPAAELEAAISAVPLDKWPPWERKLLQFGREVAFSSEPRKPEKIDPLAPGSTTADPTQQLKLQDGQGQGQGAENLQQQQIQLQMRLQEEQQSFPRRRLPGWVAECTHFISMYPRLRGSVAFNNALGVVKREVLPIYPYMQPSRHAIDKRPMAKAWCQSRLGAAVAARPVRAVAALAAAARLIPGLRALRV